MFWKGNCTLSLNLGLGQDSVMHCDMTGAVLKQPFLAARTVLVLSLHGSNHSVAIGKTQWKWESNNDNRGMSRWRSCTSKSGANRVLQKMTRINTQECQTISNGRASARCNIQVAIVDCHWCARNSPRLLFFSSILDGPAQQRAFRASDPR